ncbi:MAG: MFS transporter [Algoriphagus sp.]|uniref:MFS transporter n=1 Tax=Algoriphagus sp. TaxID=1872435 RepID=UPI002715C58C|nr:MFS transporter [Algoriphagus sp.]MDO8965919.1 MFS transporter [Algoriphagus sp.]MDP2043391.1 MFS transporter [Algoriphagus sp.]MDP3198445.1 MFS transporter [Algoriphagus sp.]MDP3471969.1 MFS transporter [Algoriphagus sp.]
MTQTINRGALFNASCLALITTAFSFSIRAGILPQLGDSFGLTAEQLGFINSMWFLGFPISMILGGLFYHIVGPANIMRIAFVTHTLGILMTIFADGYTTLLISTLFIGFGNGCTEAACNPLIADMYSGTTLNKMLNRFHMWFPGGIVLGSLVSKFMTDGGFAWQSQVWVMMIPTVAYAVLFFGKAFPKPKVEGVTSVSSNFKAMLSPVFIFLFICMALTAISEFGPQQWVGLIMGSSGASPMLILALTTGVMAVGRFFAGPVVKALGQTGVLLGGAIFASIGIFLFSTVTGPMAYVAAVIFAIGVCYFWPVMVGAVAQRVPLSGALGMSIIGGIGMFSTAIFQPIIGGWIDASRASQSAAGLAGDALELAAGQETLQKMLLFPGILIVLFIIFFIWQKGSKPAVAAAH